MHCQNCLNNVRPLQSACKSILILIWKLSVGHQLGRQWLLSFVSLTLRDKWLTHINWRHLFAVHIQMVPHVIFLSISTLIIIQMATCHFPLLIIAYWVMLTSSPAITGKFHFMVSNACLNYPILVCLTKYYLSATLSECLLQLSKSSPTFFRISSHYFSIAPRVLQVQENVRSWNSLNNVRSQQLPVKLCWYQFKADFCAPIGEAVPQIVAFLWQNDTHIHDTVADVLSKLSKQCEIFAIHWWSYADINLKLNFRHQLGRQCPRLLPSCSTMTGTSEALGPIYYQICLNNVRSPESACKTILMWIWSWVSGANYGSNATDCCTPPGKWHVHQTHWCKCIIKIVWTMWGLSLNLFVRSCWYQFEAEFQTPIRETIPQIVAFLQDDAQYTRDAGVAALSKLSEQCEISAVFLKGHANINLKLSFGHQFRRQCPRLLPSSNTMTCTPDTLV